VVIAFRCRQCPSRLATAYAVITWACEERKGGTNSKSHAIKDQESKRVWVMRNREASGFLRVPLLQRFPSCSEVVERIELRSTTVADSANFHDLDLQ
jgi:hypothetical protein